MAALITGKLERKKSRRKSSRTGARGGASAVRRQQMARTAVRLTACLALAALLPVGDAQRQNQFTVNSALPVLELSETVDNTQDFQEL